MAESFMGPATGLTNSKLALADAEASQVLAGKKFYAGDKTLKPGTMRNNGKWPDADQLTLENGKMYMYKADGYTEGGLGVASSKLGNASGWQVLSGASASSSNGISFNGSMPNRGGWTTQLDPGGSVTVPDGYHNGGGRVTARSINTNDVTGAIKYATVSHTNQVTNQNQYIIGVTWADLQHYPGDGTSEAGEYVSFSVSGDHHTIGWARNAPSAWTYAYI